MSAKKIRLAQALLDANQTELEQWFQSIDQVISEKPDLTVYEERKKLLLPKFQEATAKGVTLRKLEEITGIPHQTIGKWLKRAKEVKPC